MKILKNIIRKSVKLTSFTFLLALTFFSCSEDKDFSEAMVGVPEDVIHINFLLPAFDEVKTRDVNVDYDINELDIFFFIDNKISQHKHLDSSDISFSSKNMTYDLELRTADEKDKSKTRTVEVIANGNSLLSSEISNSNLTLSELRDKVITTSTGLAPISNGILMRGTGSTTSDNSISVTLARLSSKVIITMDSPIDDFDLLGFQVVNAAAGAFIKGTDASGEGNTANADNYYTTGATTAEASESSSGYEAYIFPTKGVSPATGSAWNQGYIIIMGSYQGEDCYYRLDLINTEGKKFDFGPNYLITVNITEVNGSGFKTIEEASKHPENIGRGGTIIADIHDHMAEIYSMVSDGIRELGVTDRIEMIAERSFNTELKIKIYSLKTEETGKAPTISFKSGSDWIQYDFVAGNSHSTESSGSHNGDTDSEGYVWTYRLKFRNFDSIFSDKEAILIVEWMGLTQEVFIFYNATFKADEAMKVSLSLKENGSTKGTLTDCYWKFVSGEGTTTSNNGSSSSIPKLHGIDVTAMADGKVRTEGFHFPMPYGITTPWTYEYSLDFSALETGGKKISNIEITPSGGFFSKNNINWSYIEGQNKASLSMASSQQNSYEYAVGSITFDISYSNPNTYSPTSLTVALYHTGFFHYDDNNYGTSTQDQGYYYYEVVPMGNSYWLDRNVGAKSNKMFLNYSSSGQIGNSDAAGRLYTIAQSGYKDTKGNVVYGDPRVNDKMCPPGYHIPNATEWDAVRLSPRFTSSQESENGRAFMSSYYDTGNQVIGHIYFPKSRYYNDDTQNIENAPSDASYVNYEEVTSGDDAAGYYWSRTASQGLEKDQIGNWLKVLNLNGSSSTYINGSVFGHRMHVRCVRGATAPAESKNAIEFNVKGATHVYLYSVDHQGNKSGVFSFPGKAIGNAQAVDNLVYDYDNSSYKTSYLHFSYTSSIPENQLYVFFVYQDANGKITIISENGASTLGEASGWEVKNGYNYFFNYMNNSFQPMFETSSSSEFPWGAEGTQKKEEEREYYYEKGKTITLEWWDKAWGQNDFYKYAWVWFSGGSKPKELNNVNYPGNAGTKVSDNKYRITYTIPKDDNIFNVVFSVSDKGGQTNDLEVGKTNGTTHNTDYTLSKDSNGNVTVTFGYYYKK